MAQTPQQFFNKNMKWLALGFGCLFLMNSVKSCNRNMSTKASEAKSVQTIDSLTKKVNILENENQRLNFELKLQSEKADAAQKRADAVQSVAEKIKTNTTVNFRGTQVDSSKK